MAKWFFNEKGKNDKERDPGWDEYFSSNRSTVESLVRESIQNSLDATAKKSKSEGRDLQSVVRIYYSGEKAQFPAAEYQEYLNVATDHYGAKDCGLDSISGDCRYFVIEDFNTDGLTGDILQENEKEPYFKFLKCENKSTKDESGSIGKWGIGKVVFPIASRIRSFFAYSIRNEKSVDKNHPREILAGECLLKYHTANGKRYTPDGWWGGRDDDGMNIPATPEKDGQAISEFKRKFNITRKDETGLSVVIPYVDAINVDELKRSIVENYMVALVSGKLRVELRDGDGSEAIYDKDHVPDMLEFLVRLAAEKDADADTKRIAEMFKMVLEAFALPAESVRKLKLYEGTKPNWQPLQFEESVIAAIRADLDKNPDAPGALTVVEVPMLINKKHEREMPTATFRVVLKRCSSVVLQVSPRFYRHGLFISHVGAQKVSGYMAVVLLDGPVADMLNEAEPPSHTQWFENTGSFSKLYNYPQASIDYVKRAPRQIIKNVDVIQDDDDFETLKSYFSISRDERLGNTPAGNSAGQGDSGNGNGAGDGSKRGGKGKYKRKRGRKPDPNRPHPPPPLPKPYILEKYKDEDAGTSCFRVIADPEHFRSFMFSAAVSYATLSGKGSYDKNDFSMQRGGTIRVLAEGVETRFPEPNVIEALISAESSSFVIEVKGFDYNRDLVVDDHYRDPSKWTTPEVNNG